MIGLLILLNVAWFLSTRKILGASSNLNAAEIINQTNQIRIKNGLLPLEQNQVLEQAAQNKAESMIQAGQFQHSYLGQNNQLVEPWQFFTDLDYQYLYAGENLAKDFSTTESLINAWLESPGHRANLLSDRYTQVGISIVEGPYLGENNSVLVVQFLGTPIPTDLQQVEISDPNNFFSTALIEQKNKLFDTLGSYPSELFLTSTFILALILLRLELQISHKHNATSPASKHWYSK